MDEDKILKEFQRLAFYRTILNLVIGAGAIITMFGGADKKVYPLCIGVIIMFVGGVSEAVYWRCPVCGKGLPMRESSDKIKHCPNCGSRLNI